jgi:hypothetical protein
MRKWAIFVKEITYKRKKEIDLLCKCIPIMCTLRELAYILPRKIKSRITLTEMVVKGTE